MTRIISGSIYIFILLFIVNRLLGQATGNISGYVYDSSTKEPLAYANVLLKGTFIGAATDKDGRFSILNVPAGDYTLLISYIGYEEKEIDVTVKPGETATVRAELNYRGVMGEEIVVTAQVEGQLSAINQQFTSNEIVNVVSKDRIEELPDVNAAESIGRLPGVAIERYGGEATKVAIRGLSPKFNAITVNDVRLPATGGDDRSVDLSLISSNILDGIELKKVVTPDMDADVFGGTVNLKLKEAPDRFNMNMAFQGGYSKNRNYYGNYQFTGSISNRFFNKRLGVIGTWHIDNYDRSADKFSAGYIRRDYEEKEFDPDIGESVNVTKIGKVPSNITLRDENVYRQRRGLSLLSDYRISYGKITANAFYNVLSWDAVNRLDNISGVNTQDNRRNFSLEKSQGTTSLFTGAMGMEQNFGFLSYDFSISRSSSEADMPYSGNSIVTFIRERNNLDATKVGPKTDPFDIPDLLTPDSAKTWFSEAYKNSIDRYEKIWSSQLNIKVPYNFGNLLHGYIKFGGKYRHVDRLNDENRVGRWGEQYGGFNGDLQTMVSYLMEKYPAVFDSTFWDTPEYEGGFPLYLVIDNKYKRDDFLGGRYPQGYIIKEDMADYLLEALFNADVNDTIDIDRVPMVDYFGRDYDGFEVHQAAYAMGEFNIGKKISVIAGVRWERDFSKYNGRKYREVTINNQPPTLEEILEAIKEGKAVTLYDYDTLTIKRDNIYTLPMILMNLKPNDWMRVRLSRTETISRPDYIQYVPRTFINVFGTWGVANNSKLKPQHAINYDLAFSFYNNYLGYLSISGFYKEIYDLILFTSFRYYSKYFQTRDVDLSGLNIPEVWLKQGPQIDTYLNNKYPGYYRGFEFEWQTNFWYLRGMFSGLVLNVNFTYITSSIKKELWKVRSKVVAFPPPPHKEYTLYDTTRTSRITDQPKYIANLTLGYDYKGFSVRLSFLYQTDKVTYIAEYPEFDSRTGPYYRWDLTFRQKLNNRIELYANFNNLNEKPDETYLGADYTRPSYIEYYGFSMDVGLRYKF
ncbi:MAG: TonB-dependent receptor [Candidatus Marinimicrobia bacterium]|nr:TonB-dependent receptor [Candidatus Neomarinimicrobiota bacterium]